MKKLNSVILLLIAGLMLGGCASTGTQMHPGVCSLIGATAGGGLVAISDSDNGPAAAGGAAVGAAIGYLLCRGPSDSDGDGVTDDLDQCPGTPAGTEVDSTGCPPAVEMEEMVVILDSDGDGVPDSDDLCPGTPAGVEVEANGCPKVGEVLMTLEGVNFAFDSDELTYESQAILDNAASTLNSNSLVNVEVVGHTDSIGSESYNHSLSERRAAAVVEYLTNNGVSGSRLSSAGMGESNPVADNTTEDGRYSNRRVELVVVE
ncbi:MAG: OmpA family protein [Gammaproteobacteria bacterium]